MSARPERQRPSATSPLRPGRLKPETEQLRVGDGVVPAPVVEAAKPKPRVPFGSYMDPALQRRFKARCVLDGIEMQAGLEEAVIAWLQVRESADQ